jgi:hypothetical protein
LPFLSEGENNSLNNWRKMSLLNDAILGNLTLAAGISATVQVVLIALMFAVTRYPYGIISDYFYALTPLLILPIILVLQKLPGINPRLIWTIFQILGVIGVVIGSTGQILLLLKVIDFKKSVWSNTFGMGFVGIPVLAYVNYGMRNGSLPTGFNLIGLILGFAMITGIPAALFFLESLAEMGHSSFEWGKANPLLYVVTFAGILAQIGLPVWLLWMARLIQTGKFMFSW